MRRRGFAHQALALFGVVALHAALLTLLHSALQEPAAHGAAPPVSPRVAVRLIRPTVPPGVLPPPMARPARPRLTVAARQRTATHAPPVGSTSPSADRVVPTAPPASAPDSPPSLLDTDATRRAIRASARVPSLHDELARARGGPDLPDVSQRLGGAMQAAGHGDCLKGEYAGAGMGLLSLPFLALAQARGACAR